MARVRAVFATLLVLSATAVCIRLGFWQLSRLHEKHVLHAAQRAQLSAPPLDVSEALPEVEPGAGRRVHVRGRWERGLHVLLSGRTHLGAAGVSLVTPVRLISGEAVWVERGWMPAADGRTAHPERFPDSTADMVGVALPLRHSPNPPRWVRLVSDSAEVTLWSARALEADSAAARIGGAMAPWLLHALPGAPESRTSDLVAPMPEPYEVPDEAMHLSYALQWFAFAAIVGFGSIAFALRGARRPGSRRA